MKKILFIDRDGTIIDEPEDEQIDSVEKLRFKRGAITCLAKIATLDYELVLVSNQDGLGTESFPIENFSPVQDLIMRTLAGEGCEFADVLIDKTFPHQNAATRKPNTGLLGKYVAGNFDLANSYVIGDRLTDVQLARNLGAKAIFIRSDSSTETPTDALFVSDWSEIYNHLKAPDRKAIIRRTTKETDIECEINLDGTGRSDIDTGIAFFDHMLSQVARHGSIDLSIQAVGDLEVDEHHTIEDVALTLGEALDVAIDKKIGIERYGFVLPMDDCLAQVAVDFGGRNYIVWDAEFKREMIGKMPTEMFFHFFKSFSDAAKCNLNIKAEGANEHHKIESIFKAFAWALKSAVRRNFESDVVASTKGVL
ncbi:MAG TPA: bifunctional histidinol-phosphatase/imidazoleglycerol-phosphate dehydratase HisB [Pyrinomonadaceae bacterium]|nr:bifunctional histidinol-phosphatase/imidazoleglycerol-phosphate dehydratase HisB [Pyrinomonadaceae bacterium]